MLVFMLLLLLYVPVYATESTCVSGTVSGYPGTTIELYYFTDEISYKQEVLTKTSIDSAGVFEFVFTLDKVRKCFVDLGAFRGILFIEPSKTYHLQPMPYQPKTDAQLLNMYFTPQEVLVGLQNQPPDDINQRILQFELAIDEVWNNAMYTDLSKRYLSAVIDSLEMVFPSKNDFFSIYKQSTYALLANLQVELAPNWSIQDYFISMPVHYHNPAYCEAFTVLFEGYFNLLESQPNAKAFFQAYHNADIVSLREQFALLTHWNNPQLEELVILYNLWGNFSLKPKDRTTTINLLEQISHTSLYPENKKLAQEVLYRLKKAHVGSKPNVNELRTIEGKTITFSDFAGKYVYIVFASSLINETYADIIYLDKLRKKYAENLEVVFIFAQETEAKTIAYTKEIGADLIFCNWNSDAQLIDAFGVQNIPSYYLLDREGFFSHSPALSPSQGFERKLDAMLEVEKAAEGSSTMNKPFF